MSQATTADVLKLLADNDGAILGWQVPSYLAAAFSQCARDGVIRLDDETDCYVHPNAVEVAPEDGEDFGGFSMVSA